MLYASFFCAGIVVGLAAGVPIIAVFWMSSKKIAEWSYRQNLIKLRAESMKSNRKLDDEIGRFKQIYGPNLTREQDKVLQEELAAVITKPRDQR